MRALVAVLGLGACAAGRDRVLAGEPLTDAPILAVFPPDDALRLLGDVPVEVVLGADADGAVPAVRFTLDGQTTALPCTLAYEGTVADCGTVSVIAGQDAALEVSVAGTLATVASEGRLPVQGLGWDLLDGLSFTALGSGGEAVRLANGFLGEGSAFTVLDGYDGSPGPWTLRAGESLLSDGTHGLVSPGLVFVLPVIVDPDGNLDGSATSAWLPALTNDGIAHLLLLDVHIGGHIDGTALRDVVLSAQLPAVTLAALASPLGLAGTELLDVVNLDVDRDGDGTFDAATIRLEGSPAPAVLTAWTEQRSPR